MEAKEIANYIAAISAYKIRYIAAMVAEEIADYIVAVSAYKMRYIAAMVTTHSRLY